ncbi:hypothetical protein ACGFYY_35995 [Streptomyces sp. NPDC048331]|uniref:hypothetical protein n=1 Tax=Streptomyces sp. NPDC048331 TaxID=3365534 RepID=UPI00372494FF
MIFKSLRATRSLQRMTVGVLASLLMVPIGIQSASATEGAVTVITDSDAMDNTPLRASVGKALCPAGMSLENAGYYFLTFLGTPKDPQYTILSSYPIIEDGRVGWLMVASKATVAVDITCVPQSKPDEQVLATGAPVKWNGTNQNNPDSVAWCPAGSTVTNGGYFFDEVATTGNPVRAVSRVIANGSTQQAAGWFVSAVGATYTAHALCTKN